MQVTCFMRCYESLSTSKIAVRVTYFLPAALSSVSLQIGLLCTSIRSLTVFKAAGAPQRDSFESKEATSYKARFGQVIPGSAQKCLELNFCTNLHQNKSLRPNTNVTKATRLAIQEFESRSQLTSNLTTNREDRSFASDRVCPAFDQCLLLT